MKEYILISTTFDNKEEANKVIEVLLEKRLVSCCQLSKIESFYHWNDYIPLHKYPSGYHAYPYEFLSILFPFRQ